MLQDQFTAGHDASAFAVQIVCVDGDGDEAVAREALQDVIVALVIRDGIAGGGAAGMISPGIDPYAVIAMKIDDQGMLTGSNGLVCTRGNAGVIDHSPEVHVGISRCRAAFRSRDGDSVWQVV